MEHTHMDAGDSRATTMLVRSMLFVLDQRTGLCCACTKICLSEVAKVKSGKSVPKGRRGRRLRRLLCRINSQGF